MKHRILDLIYKNIGSFVSGQRICEELCISRTAVWKHIKSLNAEGYKIVSSEGKGYKLTDTPDILNDYEITRRLVKNIPVYFYERLDSTNNKAKELAQDSNDEICLVVCSIQQGGRGRMGRMFESANDKGVWCSFILKPHIEPENALLITIAAATAVAKTLETAYEIKPGIKWPNDIIIKGKKVCGILSEMNCETNSINYIILGIGINISQKPDDFTKETAMIADSMYGITGQKMLRSEIIASLCYNIQEVYSAILKGNSDEILKNWKRYTITDGEEISILKNGESISAKAIGINYQGMLIAEHENGSRKEYNSGEISIKRIKNRN
ncbi:MAG: biotin--[acetyl-CoA-carboxylase] ligase [Clostridia bacterium]|nr:biotin--[acetyl-CoA-carboxylase] ligase [Clostridia bacterium]MBN2882137.1 biotin--[acetyl-CoA-carboxylase] ligase [Clostridia bacterium]